MNETSAFSCLLSCLFSLQSNIPLSFSCLVPKDEVHMDPSVIAWIHYGLPMSYGYGSILVVVVEVQWLYFYFYFYFLDIERFNQLK